MTLHDNVDQVETLLAGGDDASLTDKHGNSFIHTAAIHNSRAVLTRYISAGLTKSENEYGNTPLHLTAERGYVECVEIILRYPECASIKNKQLETPLRKAAASRNVNVVHAVLDAILGIKEDKSESAMCRPEACGNATVKRALIDQMPQSSQLDILDARDKNGRSALHRRVFTDNSYRIADIACLKELMTVLEVVWNTGDRSSPCYLDTVDKTALMYSTILGDVEAVNILLSHGADVTIEDNSYYSMALHVAATYNDFK